MPPLGSASCADKRLKRELLVNTPIGPGKGKPQRLVQELLCLNGHPIVVDSDFGSATRSALDAFCSAVGLPTGAPVDQAAMDRLAQPLLRAVRPVTPAANLGEAAVKVARQHLAEHPREVGGQNRGPWVRLYMDGNEGTEWAWCAGFATYVLAAAATAQNMPNPIKRTYSCDVLGMDARAKGKLASGASSAQPGDLFLIPRSKNDWEHVGLIERSGSPVFFTIEGNTNDDGSREGYEVCARTRACSKVNVIRL